MSGRFTKRATTESLQETLAEAKLYWEQLYRERKSVRPERLLELLKKKQISKSERKSTVTRR